MMFLPFPSFLFRMEASSIPTPGQPVGQVKIELDTGVEGNQSWQYWASMKEKAMKRKKEQLWNGTRAG